MQTTIREVMMYASDKFSSSDSELAQPSGSKARINISDIIGILLRKWLYLFLGGSIGLAVAVTYFIVKKPYYTSTARILIDKSVSRYLQSNNIVQAPTFYYDVSSQIFILQSESVILPVVRSLNLDKDPEFVPLPKEGKESPWDIDVLKGKIKGVIKRFLGRGPVPGDESGDPEETADKIAAASVLDRLTVNQAYIPTIVNVSFTSEDPKKAAIIANAIAETFLDVTRNTKIESTKTASAYLQERLLGLKKQIVNAELELQEYKIRHGLAKLKAADLATEKLARLSSHLVTSQIALVEAKARLERIKNVSVDRAPNALFPNNEVLTRLRSRYLQLNSQLNELESRLGPTHKAVVDLRSQLVELNNAINNEKTRAAAEFSSEYQISKEKNSELTAELAQLVKDAEARYKSQVKMKELESRVETFRSLYNGVFQKFNTMPLTTQLEEARILTKAAPPHRQLVTKKSLAILGGSIMFGFLLGAGLAVGRELGPGTFRTPQEVTAMASVPCVLLPLVKGRSLLTSLLSFRRRAKSVDRWVSHAPFSRFAEGIRSIEACLLTGEQDQQRGNVIGIISSVAKEGKTTVANNLATSLGLSGASRILLIDGDIHGRRLTQALMPDASEGLFEALKDHTQLESLVMQGGETTADFLPCVLTERTPDAARTLGSREMRTLLDAARGTYDFVLIEIAPVASVVDVKMINRFVDGYIFVIEWGRTRRRLVEEVLTDMKFIRERLLCTVLNKADPGTLKYIETYKGDRFKQYYIG